MTSKDEGDGGADIRTDEQAYRSAVQDMDKAGVRDGKAAGGWIADGNTDEASLRAVLRQWEEGDPAAPCAPCPFSGEWADSPTVEDVINAETAFDADDLSPEERDELATAYEDAFAQAWQDEAERTVRGLLPDEE